MAFSETLAIRLRDYFFANDVTFEEKKMMGGLCFMVNDKMCVGINDDELMVRTDPAIYDELQKKEECRPMDFTGRPMKGFLYIDGKILPKQSNFAYWVDLALEFNPSARSSKKRKRTKKKTKRFTIETV